MKLISGAFALKTMSLHYASAKKAHIFFLAGDKYQFCKQMKWNPSALLKTLLTRDSACKLNYCHALLVKATSCLINTHCERVCFLLFLGPRQRVILFHFETSIGCALLFRISGVRFHFHGRCQTQQLLEADLVRRRLLTLTRALF